MKRLQLVLLSWVLFLLPSLLLHAVQEELREPDVLYFDQTLPDKVLLTLEKSVRVYLDKDFQVLAAALPSGAKLQIVGIGSDGNYLVSTQYRGTRIEGWVKLSDLPPLDPKILEAARQAQARNDAVQKAIKERRVIQGMSLAEVGKAMGKPDRTAFRQDAQARIDTWTYITYDLVPQNTYVTDALGRTSLQTVYVKSPTGELTIDFTNGSVVSVEQHKREVR